MWFEDFQDGHHGGHLGCRNRMILATLNLYVASLPPTKFGLNPTGFMIRMWFEDFQDGHYGGHLGYLNIKILAILNLYVALMPPIKLRLKSTNP